MSGLSSLVSVQQQQPFITPDFKLDPDLVLDTAAPCLLSPAQPTTSKKAKKISKHHSKRHKRKDEKRHRKQQFGAYLLQLIGLICLVLAAVKAFEPLTGVGFTLVIVGYKAGLGDGGVRDVLRSKKRSGKSKGRKGEEKDEKEARAERKDKLEEGIERV